MQFINKLVLKVRPLTTLSLKLVSSKKVINFVNYMLSIAIQIIGDTFFAYFRPLPHVVMWHSDFNLNLFLNLNFTFQKSQNTKLWFKNLENCHVTLWLSPSLHRNLIYRRRMLKISRDQVPARRQLMINPFLAGNSNFSFKKADFKH